VFEILVTFGKILYLLKDDNLAKTPDYHHVISTIGRNLESYQKVTAKDFSLSLEMTDFLDFLRDHQRYLSVRRYLSIKGT